LAKLRRWEICMPSSKYHREQAQVLAGLALSTNDATEADRFTLAAMEHLERAQASDAADSVPPRAPEPGTDKYAHRD
jgi:hypothetical protein